MDNQSSLGDILNSLLQNPEVMKAVSSIAKDTVAAAPSEDAVSKEETATSTEPPLKNEGDTLSIPPELLSKLPQIMQALSGFGASLPSTGKSEGKTSTAKNHRKELLRAIKPFLSEKRCSMIDGFLQFEGLWGILDSFMGSNTN